jgi:hypothetical protein
MSHPPGTPEPSSGQPEPDEDPDSGQAEGREPGASAAPPSYGSTAFPQGGHGEQPPYGQPGPPQPGYAPPGYGQQGYPPAAYGDPYAQQPYGAYGYPGPGLMRPRNGKAIAALWTGIGALVLTPCCGAGVLGLLPIVLGVKARSEIRANGGQQEGDGMALAGIICGVVAVVLSLALIAAIVIAIARGGAGGTSFGETGV